MRKILSYGTADQMLSAFEQRIAVLEDSQDASVQSATSVKGATRRSNFSRGTADQMLEAFESKIAELEGSDVESATDIIAGVVKKNNYAEVESNLDNADSFVPVLVHSVNGELEELDIFDSWTWEQQDSELILTTVTDSDVQEYSIPYSDLQMDESNPEEDVQYIMKAIIADDNDEVTSATKIEASDKSVVIPASAKTQYYKDIGGVFGDTNAVYSLEDLMIIWNSECNSDPTMSQYASFNDWWQDTKQFMSPVTNSTSVESSDDFAYDYCEIDGTFEKIASKQVPDSDGFYTDYTMYRNLETGEYVFVFGDSDYYSPEEGNYDYECDSEEEAYEWFESYNGFGEDNVYTSSEIQCSEDDRYEIEPLTADGFCDMFVPYLDTDTIEKAANLLYEWYSAEGEEYMPNRNDVLDMCDAADNEEDKRLVLYALGEIAEDEVNCSTVADNGEQVFQLMEYNSYPEAGIEGDDFYCYGEFFATDEDDALKQLEEAKSAYPKFANLADQARLFVQPYNEHFSTGGEIYQNVSAIAQHLNQDFHDEEIPFA